MAATNIAVRRAEAHELRRIFEIRVQALADDKWTRLIYPTGRSQETIDSGIESWRQAMTDQFQVLLVAVDSHSGTILAFAKWLLVHHPKETSETFTASSAGPEADDSAWQSFDRASHEAHTRLMRDRPHYCLAYLCTDPNHQGKGAGSLLLKWGTDVADQSGRECYLASTNAGKGLYLRHGFEELENFQMKAPQGVDGMARIDYMRRPPQ